MGDDNVLNSWEDQLDWIDAWATYVAHAPDEEWGLIHNIIVDSEVSEMQQRPEQ